MTIFDRATLIRMIAGHPASTSDDLEDLVRAVTDAAALTARERADTLATMADEYRMIADDEDAAGEDD